MLGLGICMFYPRLVAWEFYRFFFSDSLSLPPLPPLLAKFARFRHGSTSPALCMMCDLKVLTIR